MLTRDDKSLRYVNSLSVRSFCKNDCHAYLFVFVALVTDLSEFVPGFFACISLSFGRQLFSLAWLVQLVDGINSVTESFRKRIKALSK